MRYSLLVLLSFLSIIVSAQKIVIQGSVINSEGEALTGANIVIRKPHNQDILAYTISQEQGKYLLQIAKQVDSLEITASFLGYIPEKIIKPAISQNLDFVLSVSNEQLKEVIIKTQPVNIKGDTINYKVSALKRLEDKVLADVIKRIPGIEVKPNGIIYYEGKAINKFYIENMDMLNGRYNLASNNLPVEDIASVQVYENHQPIKLLDSLVYSDRAALNIRLKKNFTYALPFEMAAGYQPILWSGKFVPMIFRKKKQSLALLQTNNTGNSLNNQILNFYRQNAYSISGNNDTYWTKTTHLTPPPLEEDKWLDNTSYLASLNLLLKLNQTAYIKTNMSYLPEKIDETGYNEQQILLDNQILTILNKQTHRQHKRYADFNLVYEQNSKKNYLTNSIHLKYNNVMDNSFVSNKNISQNASRPTYVINDELSWLFPLGKQLYRLNASVDYESKTEDYLVKPGSFSNIFNNANMYEFLKQKIDEQKLHMDINTGFIKKMNWFTLEYSIDLQSQFGWLDTCIFTSESNNFDDTSFKNQTEANKLILANQITGSYKTDAWYFSLELPFKYVDYTIKDRKLETSKSVHDFVLEYDAGLQYHINKFTFYLSQSRNATYNNLNSNHFGYILKSYDRLERYNAPIKKDNLMRSVFHIKYKDILNGINVKLNFSFNTKRSNIIYQYQYLLTGLYELNAISKIIHSETKQAQLFFSKYFFRSKISTKINMLYEVSQRPVIINERLYNKRLNTLRFISSLSLPVHKSLSVYFKFSSNKFFFDEGNHNIDNYNLKSELFWYPIKNHQIHFSVDYYLTPSEQLRDSFLNISYKFTPKKKRWSVYGKWYNITSLDIYTSYFSDATFSYKNVYYLRPSYVLIGFETNL